MGVSMTVLSAQSIRAACLTAMGPRMIVPFSERTQHEESGCSYGLSACGYDVRLDQDVRLWSGWMRENGHHTEEEPVVRQLTEKPPTTFSLASTIEQFQMPHDIVGIVHDKSTWARRGLAVQNTVIEPGWRGFLTLELTFHGKGVLIIPAGSPIAQILFHRLDDTTDQPYPEAGKYMDQERGPVPARSGVGHE